MADPCLAIGTQEEAAEAYDRAAIEYRGAAAVTNFELTRYSQWVLLTWPRPYLLRFFFYFLIFPEELGNSVVIKGEILI